jgi:hypothetical protein
MSKKIDLNKFKDVVGQLKTKQQKLQSLMSKETIKEAKKYAESSKQELQKLIKSTDVKKVKSIIEKEAKEIQKLQQSIPQELAKFSKFMETQKKEFEKILKSVSALEAADFIQKKVSSKVGLGKKPKASSSGTKRASKKPTVVKEAAAEKSAPVSTEEAKSE